MPVVLLIVAAAAALADWAAVQWRLFRLEYVCKPATLALLVAAAATAGGNGWVVAALACGLAGDIGLMLSASDAPDVPFLGGLGAFLLGHIAYLVAFTRHGLHVADVVAGVLVVGGISALALPAVLRGAARAAGRPFAVIVAVYATVLGGMAALAVGTGSLSAALGGVLFLASDTVIARERFVQRMRHGDVVIIVTYHAAQFLLLLGLVRIP